MKTVTKKLLPLIAGGIIMAATMSSSAAQTVLTVSGWTPPRHHFTKLLQDEWAKQVEQESNGLLKIRYLPRAPMGAAQTFDGVRDGLVDISFISHGNTPGRFRLTKIAEFPFLADKAEDLSVAYQRVFEKHLAKGNEHEGVVPLAMFTPGPGHLMSPRAEYKNKASLQGQKLRAPGGMAFDLATSLGSVPVSRPASELYELLNGGIVDGALMPADVFGGWRLEELIRNVVSVPGGFYNASFALIMNEAKFNSLTDAEREALLKVTGESFSRIAGRASDEADNRGWKIYEDSGGQRQTASETFFAEIRDAVGPLEDAWHANVADTGIDAKAALDELRDEIKKIEGQE
ncbi:TRAP transporter substrate-binding protein [Paenochrobactrum sp. BZR 201-1]